MNGMTMDNAKTVLEVLGIGAIFIGLWLVWPPLALIAAGGTAIFLAWVVERIGDNDDNQSSD